MTMTGQVSADEQTFQTEFKLNDKGNYVGDYQNYYVTIFQGRGGWRWILNGHMGVPCPTPYEAFQNFAGWTRFTERQRRIYHTGILDPQGEGDRVGDWWVLVKFVVEDDETGYVVTAVGQLDDIYKTSREALEAVLDGKYTAIYIDNNMRWDSHRGAEDDKIIAICQMLHDKEGQKDLALRGQGDGYEEYCMGAWAEVMQKHMESELSLYKSERFSA